MHKIFFILIALPLLAGLAGLAGCASHPSLAMKVAESPPADKRDPLLASLAGEWDNRAQFTAAADALKVPPSVNGDWLDLQHASFVKVDAPLIGTHVLYLEWRNSNREGAISRQRIWSFRFDEAGQIRMDFYAFVDGAPWAGRVRSDDPANKALFRTLGLAELRGYGAACGLRFEVNGSMYRGDITASECSLVAASGRRMGIDASVARLADGTMEYRESGQLADGRYAFRVPPTMPYRFVRQP